MSQRIFIIVFSLVLSLGLNGLVYSQISIDNSKKDLKTERLAEPTINEQGVVNVFARLSLSYEIPIGLEIASNDNGLAKYEIYFDDGTLSEIINQIVDQINQSQNQYSWEIEDGVVNIFPKEIYKDTLLTSLLEIKINSFSVKKNTSCIQLANSLISSPEISPVIKSYGLTHSGVTPGGFYFRQVGKDFTLDVSNMSLKSILNKVVKESPIAKIWYIKRNSYDPGTFTLGLNSKQESPVVFAPTGPGPIEF